MNKQLTLKINTTLILTGLLCLVVGLLIGAWSPWQTSGEARTVTLEGSSTIEVEPDEFVFYPSVQTTSATQQKAKEEAQAKGQALADSILKLGLEESQLNSSLDVYQNFRPEDQTNDEWQGNYRLTITAKTQEQSDAVYQVLLDNPDISSGVDPASQLSDAKRKEVENQARSQAIEDARSQAQTSADKLGGKLGEVVSFEDVSGFGVYPFATTEIALDSATASSAANRDFFGGTQEVTFTVSVTFELR